MNVKGIFLILAVLLGAVFVLPKLMQAGATPGVGQDAAGEALAGAASPEGIEGWIRNILPSFTWMAFAPCLAAAALAMLFWKKFPILKWVLTGCAIMYFVLVFTGKA